MLDGFVTNGAVNRLSEPWRPDNAYAEPDQFIRRLRKTFESDPAQPRHFITIRDAGYRFLSRPRDA